MDDSHVSGIADADSDQLIDRLSELPDSLILHILSLLPMRDVVPTTLLSKRWKDLWTTVPGLDLRNPTDDDLDKFHIFVCRFLALWRGAKILRFSFTFMIDLSMTYLDTLLHFAIEKQVEELYIELTQYEKYWPYKESVCYVPQRLYSCSSITKLTLVSFKLSISQRVQWNQLKSLTIQGGEDSLIEQVMNHILSGSPGLEVLNLCIRESGENLNIESTSLKMLKIDMYLAGFSDVVAREARLRIRAPNLESLEISGVSYGRCLMNVSSLTSAILGFDARDYSVVMEEMLSQLFLSVCHVEKITLTDCCIKVLLDMQKKKDMLVPLSNAKFLKIYAGEADGMLDVLEIFPELMKLIVEHNEVTTLFLEEEPYIVKVDACNNTLAPKSILPNSSILQLKTVEITWHLHDASIMAVIEILLENAQMLEKMVIQLRTGGTDPEMFVLAEEKVLSMPKSSPNVEVELMSHYKRSYAPICSLSLSLFQLFFMLLFGCFLQ